MANDSALSISPSEAPTPATIAAALASIPDDVQQAPTLEQMQQQQMAAAPVLEPWASTNVAWLVPLAGKLIQLPYEQIAKRTHDDCWLVTDDQIQILNPALENALKWTVWRLGAANTIGHPLVAFGVAMASLTAVKYGMYQYNESQRKEGGPQKASSPPFINQQQQQPPRPTSMDTMTTSGKMVASAGASSSAENPAAGSLGSSRKEFVVVDE